MAGPSIGEAARRANPIVRAQTKNPALRRGFRIVVLQCVSGFGPADLDGPAAARAFGRRPAAADRASAARHLAADRPAGRADCPAVAGRGSGWDFDSGSFCFLPTLVVWRSPPERI